MKAVPAALLMALGMMAMTQPATAAEDRKRGRSAAHARLGPAMRSAAATVRTGRPLHFAPSASAIRSNTWKRPWARA